MRLACRICCALVCASCAVVHPPVEHRAVVVPAATLEVIRPTGPISGGTLRISRDGALAAVSDPDRDRVWIVDLDAARVRAEVVLEPGDEPGRITEDYGGRFHVALRRSGSVATIDASGAVMMRRYACPAPRGIELASDGDSFHVACAGGELVTFGIFDAEPRRKLHLAPDLRDVIVDGDLIRISRFRAAEVLTIDGEGKVVSVRRPDAWDMDTFLGAPATDRPRRTFEANVAWRLVKDPSSSQLYVLHQRAATFPIDLTATDDRPRIAPYGGATPSALSACPPGILHAAFTPLSVRLASPPEHPPPPSVLDAIPPPRRQLPPSGPILGNGVLPVDVAMSDDGGKIAIAFAGNAVDQLVVGDTEQSGACFQPDFADPSVTASLVYEQPIAVAWIGRRLAVQYRYPHALVIYGARWSEGVAIALGPRETRRDLGQALFHAATPANLACASCHPEGGDDGRTWHLGAFGGVRRTQTLGGGVLAAAPLHWAGDLTTFEALVDEVLVDRMGGRSLSTVESAALAGFVDAIPAPPRAETEDAEAVERGRALFASTGCDGCHRGPRFSDDRNHDVGTGEALQTPTLLGLAARAPYFHDGRAATLESRFSQWHTPGHGDLEGLDEAQMGDLVRYLASL